MDKALREHQELKSIEMESRNEMKNQIGGEIRGLDLDDNDRDNISMNVSHPNRVVCYNCGKYGHLATDCPDKVPNRERPPP